MPATGTPTVETVTIRYRDEDLNMVGTIRIEASPSGSLRRPSCSADEFFPPEDSYLFDAEYFVESITQTFYDEDGRSYGDYTFRYPYDDGHIVDSSRVNAFLRSFLDSARHDEIMNELEYHF